MFPTIKHTTGPTLSDRNMFIVRYQTPYNDCEWREQQFKTIQEAENMVEFYRSCGSPAKLVDYAVTDR